MQASSDDSQSVVILIQPAKHLTFRHDNHCVVYGEGSKTKKGGDTIYPKVRVNFDWNKIRVSCVTKNYPYRPHPHLLHSKNREEYQDESGVVTIHNYKSREVELILKLQKVKGNERDISKVMETRKKMGIDPFKTGFDNPASFVSSKSSESSAAHYVRLAIEVFKEPLGSGAAVVATDKITSHQVPVIKKQSHHDGPVGGGTLILMFTSKLTGSIYQYKLKFLEEATGWCEFVSPMYKHENSGLEVMSPPYRGPNIYRIVNVKIYLIYNPEEGEVYTSTPTTFAYLHQGRLPSETSQYVVSEALVSLEESMGTGPDERNNQSVTMTPPSTQNIVLHNLDHNIQTLDSQGDSLGHQTSLNNAPIIDTNKLQNLQDSQTIKPLMFPIPQEDEVKQEYTDKSIAASYPDNTMHYCIPLQLHTSVHIPIYSSQTPLLHSTWPLQANSSAQTPLCSPQSPFPYSTTPLQTNSSAQTPLSSTQPPLPHSTRPLQKNSSAQTPLCSPQPPFPHSTKPMQTNSSTQTPLSSTQPPFPHSTKPMQTNSSAQTPMSSTQPPLPHSTRPLQTNSSAQTPMSSTQPPLPHSTRPLQTNSSAQTPMSSTQPPLPHSTRPLQTNSSSLTPLSSTQPPLQTNSSSHTPLSSTQPPLQTNSSSHTPLSSTQPPLLHSTRPMQTNSSAQTPLSSTQPPLRHSTRPLQTNSSSQTPLCSPQPLFLHSTTPLQTNSSALTPLSSTTDHISTQPPLPHSTRPLQTNSSSQTPMSSNQPPWPHSSVHTPQYPFTNTMSHETVPPQPQSSAHSPMPPPVETMSLSVTTPQPDLSVLTPTYPFQQTLSHNMALLQPNSSVLTPMHTPVQTSHDSVLLPPQSSAHTLQGVAPDLGPEENTRSNDQLLGPHSNLRSMPDLLNEFDQPPPDESWYRQILSGDLPPTDPNSDLADDSTRENQSVNFFESIDFSFLNL